MVSKNNFRNKMEAEAKRVPHFGLRKLSVGVASVLLSTTLYFGVTAHADTNVVTANSDQENVTEASGSVKQEYQEPKVALGSNTAGSANGQSGSQTDSQSGSQSDVQSSSQTNLQSGSQSGSQANQAPVAGQQDNKTKQTLNTLLDATSRYNGNLYIQSLVVDTSDMNTGDTVKYQAGTAGVNDSFNRYVTRTIHVVKPDNTKIADQTQTIHFVREDANGNAGTVNDDKTIKYVGWVVLGADGKPTDQTFGHFDEVALPKIPGYAAEDQQGSSIVDVTKGTVAASVVLPYMVNQEVTVVYRALGTNKPIYLVDEKTGQVVADLSVTGVPGQVIKLDQTVPDGYKLAAGQSIPESVTIDPNDVSPLDIKVDELVVDVPASSPVNTGDSVPGTQNVKFTSGLSEADLNRTVTRTVTIVPPKGRSLPDGVNATHTDTVSFHRNAHFNAVTGAITYDAWTENGQHTFAQVDAPAFDGYKANRDDVSGNVVVTPDNQNITGEITYVPVVEGATIHFYDPTLGGGQADQVINSFTVPVDDDQGGTTGTPFTLSTDDLQTNLHNLDMDDYFEIDPGTTVSGTYGPNKEYYVAVKHRIFKIDYSNLDQSSWTMPDGDTVPSKITIGAIDRKINRRVYVNPPKGYTLPDNIQLQEQHAEFVRDAYVDMGLIYEDGDKEADNVTAFGPWHTAIVDPTSGRVTGINNNSSSVDFSGIVAPEITGYTPDESAAAVTVTPDTALQDITINYVANDHQGKISYVDGSTEVGSDQISGKSEAQIEVTPVAPTGYEFDDGQGAARVVTVPASGVIPTITVHVHHKIINVTPDHPVDQNGQTDTNHPIQGAHESDLNQTITRTIRVTDPQGKVTTQTQSVHLTRTATYDDVTGGVSYGQWTTGTWDEYTAPAITGYTPSQKVPAVTVTDGIKDATVDVVYNPIQENAKIIYQDADNADLQVGFTAISGQTGASVPINPVAPAGFEIVPGQGTSSSVIVPADGLQDVIVEVQHKHITVQPGDLPKPGDKRPGNSHKQPGDGTPNQDITYDSLHRNMTRTINVTDPHTGLKTTKFILNYQRMVTIDDVTGKVTYGDWTVVAGSPAGFSAFNIPNVPGYISKIDSGTLEELMPLNPTQDQVTNWQDQTINISYTADNQSFTIDYVDSQGQPVTGGHFVVSGATDQKVNTNAKIPTGWELMPGQEDAPTTFTFDGTKTPQDLTIKIQHKIINVSYSQNPKVDPRIDKTDTNQLINGGQKFDWAKSVTRTVNIHDPHGGVNTTKQVATLHRDANYDDVTGSVTYGDWSVDNTSWTEVDIPTVPGYATDDGQTQVPSMPVDGKTTDITIDVTYSPADQVTHINYVGPDGKTVKSYTFAGKTDQTVDVTAPIPTGWVLASGATAAPKQIIFTGVSTPDWNIKIVHGTTQITHDHPAQSGAKTPTGKAITGASQDDLNQTITRTITVHEPGKDVNTITQTAKIFRDATVDDVTGEVTYTAWSRDATDWAEYDAPVHAGYTVSQAKVDAVTVADGQKDVNVDITYAAQDQVGEIVYIDVDDHNAEVGHTDLAGKTDQNVTIAPKAPAGYDIVSGQNIPATEVAGPDGIPKVTVKVSHHKVTVTPGQEPKPGDKISGNPDKQPGDGTPKTDVSYETLHRDMTRTINVTDPHTGLQTTKTTIHYERTATIDDVTGAVTYGNWTVSAGSAAGFDAFNIPAVAGYTSEIKSGFADDLQALTPSQDQITNWTDQTVDIDYTANDQSMTIDYMDKDGHPVDGGHFVVSGKTGQTVNTNAMIPAGWVLSQGQSDAPKTITFTGEPTANVKITIEHGIKHVTHDAPLNMGDKTPTDVTINGAHEGDLNQTITRTINITKPGEKTQATTQIAKIFRDATVDEVTGKVTYGDWSTDDTDWTQVDVPSLPGYTTYQSDDQTGIPAVTVKDGQKDVTINVTYSANGQFMDINYVDSDGHKIATFHVTGHTDETVNTNAKIPAGWVLAKGQTDAPGSVTFCGAHTDDVNVVIEHGTHQVKHGSPEDSGATTSSGKVINGAHEDDLNKTITRTINVTTPDGQTTTTHQDASIYRDATVDDVTGEVTYGAWSTSSWDDFKPKVVDGYTASQADVPRTAVTSATEPVTVNITYTANAQAAAINYMINGEVIKSTPLNGVTDQTLTGLTYMAPDGYEIVEGQNLPTEYTFKAKDNAPIVVQLVHKQRLVVHFVGLDGNDIKGVAPVTVDGVTGQVVTVPKSAMPAGYQMLAGQNIPDTFMLNDNDDNYLSIIVTPIMVTVKGSAPVKTGDIIPNTNGAKYPAELTQADLIKTITRTIHIAKPDGKIGEVAQIVKFSRDATLNAATGEISYDAWVPSGRQDFEAYTPEVIDGFTVESAPSQAVTPESQDSEITLTYKQISQVKAPIYIDDHGHALDKIPDGYHVVPGQVTDKGSQLVVKDHQVVVPKVEYVTRTITVTMPNGKTRMITQRARKGTKFVTAHLPHLKGYTAKVTVGGTYGATEANGDVAVSVRFVKSANK